MPPTTQGGNGSTIVSLNNFTTFGDFVLATASDTPVGANPLPVELTRFIATLHSNGVRLTWATASEKNSDFFEVERSLTGKAFERIGAVKAAGNSTAPLQYELLDKSQLTGLVYYRLRQVDRDGTVSYSQVAVVGENTKLQDAEVTVYPNPVQDNQNLHLTGVRPGTSVRLLDLTGRTLRTEALAENGELSLSNLAAGTYIVSLGDADQRVTRRITKR